MNRFDALVPARLRRLGRRLARSPDVGGVYWGARSRRGQWTDEPCLSVEVHRKLPRRRLTLDRLLPTEIDGLRVDVVEVGAVLGASLSHAALVSAPGGIASTITCVRTDGAGARLALLSGHGTLPLVDHAVVRSYDRAGGLGAPVTASGPTGLHRGHLRLGRLSPTLDFALAEFPEASVEPRHALGGRVARRAPLVAREKVHHHSSLDHQRRTGIIDLGLTDHRITFGGVVVRFARLIRVHAVPGGAPFGRLGDSGSLVVDDAREAIGVVVGVDPNLSFTYVLPLYGLYHQHFDVFSTFFA